MEGQRDRGIERERKKEKESERNRHVDSTHFWIALHDGLQRFNWIKPVATRDAPCTRSARTTPRSLQLEGRGRRSARRRGREYRVMKNPAAAKAEFTRFSSPSDHLESLRTSSTLDERVFLHSMFLVTLRDCAHLPYIPLYFLATVGRFLKEFQIRNARQMCYFVALSSFISRLICFIDYLSISFPTI